MISSKVAIIIRFLNKNSHVFPMMAFLARKNKDFARPVIRIFMANELWANSEWK
jgi:hypothetical protein